jgi:hypothetical protein
MAESNSSALETIKAKTGVELRFTPNAFTVISGSKEGNMTYDDIAQEVVKNGVAPQMIEALGTALRLKANSH